MSDIHRFLENHATLSRRYFLRLGIADSAATGMSLLLSVTERTNLAWLAI